MIMCLSSEKMGRCPSDVTVLSTHPPTAGWHSVVVCVEGLLSPQTSQQNRSSTHLTHGRRHGDVPQMWFSQRNSHKEHELRKGDLKDILVVISKNTRQAEFGWTENNSEEAGHA